MSESGAHTWVEIEFYPGDPTEACFYCHGSRLFVEDDPCPGQPFGFTWADVGLLREEIRSEHAIPGGLSVTGEELQDLADRIAARLPPRPEM